VAAIALGQWTEKRDVKMDANVNQRSEIVAATFTLDQPERMMGVALNAAETQLEEKRAKCSHSLSFQRGGQRAKRVGASPGDGPAETGRAGGTGHQTAHSRRTDTAPAPDDR
jgi:hypothetical protein